MSNQANSAEISADQLSYSEFNSVYYETDDSEIKSIVEELTDEVICIVEAKSQQLLSSTSSDHNLKPLAKDLVPTATISQSQSWNLGVSHTGRIMDPICLQQNIFSSIAAENLVEYQWPAGTSGDYYMLQEQVSTFLNITSFKRKYPEIERRKLDPDEVNHLLSNHVISEVQVTLGLTALRSADVCDMMMREYPEKYNEYSKVMQEREKQKIRNKYKEYVSANTPVEKSTMTNSLKKAMRQAAAYNAHLNRQRKEDFSVYYDMSTNVLQYPRNKVRKVDPSLTKPSLYPCALIPGQFQEYFQKYTKDELMYFPLNTALYGPPPPPPTLTGEELSDSGSDSGGESVNSGSSLPRSMKSTSSNKVKKKTDTLRTSVAEENAAMDVNGTPAAEGSAGNEKMTEEQPELVPESPDTPVCGICKNDETLNKKGEPEDLIKCSQCDNHGHPSCLEMSSELVTVILTYDWQCMECKTCTICSKPHREDLMMFCDRCDRGYHTFCVSLRAIPSGVWACSRCTFADPDFIKRRRKQMRASRSPSSRGRGGKRRRQRQTDPKQAAVADMDESNLTSSDIESSRDSASVMTSEVPTPSAESERKPLVAVIKASADNNGFEISSPIRESKKPDVPDKL